MTLNFDIPALFGKRLEHSNNKHTELAPNRNASNQLPLFVDMIRIHVSSTSDVDSQKLLVA